MARKKMSGKAKKSTTANKKILKTTGKKLKKSAKSVKTTKAVKTVKSAVKRKKKVAAIPKGYHNIIPYLIVNHAAKAIEFYKKAFGAKVAMLMDHPGGKVGHAELKIGDSKIMLADECPEMHARSPKAFGGCPMGIHMYVKNSDAVIAKAVSLGAKVTKPIEDMFYGDRSGMIEDPYGYTWCISTHIEDVTKATMKKRAAQLFGSKK
jgi:PhnB protein